MQASSNLTEREREILALIASGATNKEIAQKLFITGNTVKVHLRNIFSKIGVTSRTEAAVYALRDGLAAPVNLPAPVESPQMALKVPSSRWRLILAVLLLAGGLMAFLLFWQRTLPAADVPTPVSTPIQRWQTLADLPTARSGLAVASYENQIYAIAGQSADGVVGIVEKYDVSTNTWDSLPPKTLPVADVGAAVIGGKIYIPGGRLASGEVTAVMEAYDPLQKRWEQRSSLPVALSAYALAAFEGKLYLFGGWNGQEFLASAYEYDPGQDDWIERTPMPTARGFAGAAVAGGKIYVVGGYDGKEALAVNEEYVPELDNWTARARIPEARFAVGMTSVADIIYLVGGEGETGSSLPPLQYIHQQDQWQEFEGPPSQRWSHLGLVPFQTQLYGVGGRWNDMPATQNLSYQAIYTIIIPIIP